MSAARILGFFVLLAVLVGGWYWYTHRPVAADILSPYTLSAKGDRDYAEQTQYYSIDVKYPNRTALYSTAIAADVRARQTIEKALLRQITDFKNAADNANLTDEEKQFMLERPYELDAVYTPYGSAHYVSYKFELYEDTGGAHPNGFYLTFVFDRQGNLMELADLFAPQSDYLERLSSIAKQRIVAELSARMELSEADASSTLFAEGVQPKADNFRNFALDGNALVILIPPYQVAAYAAGPFEIRIPFSELKDIARKDVP